VNEGETLTSLGRAVEAIPILERALAIQAQSSKSGGDWYYRTRLAGALRASGDPRRALEQDLLARDGAVRSGEEGRYDESFPLTGIGEDLLALGRPAEAVDPLERAVRERSDDKLAFEVAESRFALARALLGKGDRARARAVAVTARDAIRPDAARYGSWFGTMLASIEAWLAGHS
jgi:tetratricopeptide (TPR) repeat protein